MDVRLYLLEKSEREYWRGIKGPQTRNKRATRKVVFAVLFIVEDSQEGFERLPVGLETLFCSWGGNYYRLDAR